MQSQVKPSHCCRQTPWLAQDSSVQVVLGPGAAGGRDTPAQPGPTLPGGAGLSSARLKGPSTDQGDGWAWEAQRLPGLAWNYAKCPEREAKGGPATFYPAVPCPRARGTGSHRA